MTRSDDKHRERDLTAATLEALLLAITNRLTEVTIAKVKGRQGRKGTRHWAPAAGEPLSVKALDPATVVDPEQWREQIMQAAMQVLGPAGAAEGTRLRAQLRDGGVETLPAEEAPVTEQPPPSMIPPQSGSPDEPDFHPVVDYAIIRAVRWLADAGAAKAAELRARIAKAEAADLERLQAQATIDAVRQLAAREGASVEPIVTAIRDWQTGPDGDTGLASWSRTRAEAATTATIEGVRHGLLTDLPGNVTVTRTWRTRKDDRVRPAHAAAEGQTIAAGDTFTVGGEAMRYPGDPLGSPGNVINCRCHAPFKVTVAPEAKDLVRTPEGAAHYGVPIGSVIEPHHKPTKDRPYTLPGNVDAVGWGFEHEESLEDVRKFLLGGIGDRDEAGHKPASTSEALRSVVSHDESSQAKQAVAADLAGRMSMVSDEDLLNCRVGGLLSDLRTANDPSVTWMRNRLNGIWQPQEPDPELHAAVTEGRWDDVVEQTSVHIGDRAIKPYVGGPQDSFAVGGPDMVRRLREQAVSDLVGKWAETSNDHSGWALAIQDIIAEEFGVKDAAPWEVDADQVQGRDDVIKLHGAALRGFIHAQYAATQERLEQAGLDTLNLYRGMHWDNADDAPDWAHGIGVEDGLEVPLRPASSFTANGETATFFAKVGGTVGQDPGASLILSAAVPRERILASPRTGVGCLGEWEFVVLGGAGTFSAVAEGLEADSDAPFTDNELRYMPVSSFHDEEVLRALTLKPDDKRRKELLKRADDLGIQMKALPTGGDQPAAGPSPADVRNEDWIKTRSWDVRDYTGEPVTTLAGLAARLGVDEDQAKRWLATMPAGEAAPKALRREAGLKGGREVKAFDAGKHPRGVHGRWAHLPGLDTTDYEGRAGDRSHITRIQRGRMPTAEIADLPGVKGERPGEHTNRQGDRWDAFKADIAENGIRNPIFITVDPGEDPKISEGNHRRDAAVELGHPDVPVEIRYFGHAEKPPPERLAGQIQVDDIVRSRSGRLYRVNDAMIPASGGHLRMNRLYDVTDLETGLPNAFDGTEITKLPKREADAARAKYEVKGPGMDELEGKAAIEMVRPHPAHGVPVDFDPTKHPRGGHGRFAHTWLHIMKSHTSRDPHQVLADVLAGHGGGDEPPSIEWKKHLDGFVSDDGRYYIERRISGNRLYVKADAGDEAAEPLDGAPFPHGRLLDTGSMSELKAKATDHASAGRLQGLHSDDGGRSDEPAVRGDGGSQLAGERAGSGGDARGPGGVLRGTGGERAGADRPRDGGEPRTGGGDLPAADAPAERRPADGGGDRGPGIADPAAAADRGPRPDDRDAAAGAGEPGGPGSAAGADGLPGSGDGTGSEEPELADLPTPDPSAVPVDVGGEDFQPEGIDDLSPAGKAAKLAGNLEALRTLRRLQAEKRAATPEEQQTLARWAGWGGIPEVFDPSKPEHAKHYAELTTLLSPAEIREARRNTLNAHYTDARVVKSVWKAVEELGFDGGRVLEPGSGSGTFIGFAPDNAQMVGVELDSTTAAISKYLYPSATIRNESFADTNVPDGSFDLTIGNVPFNRRALTDRRHNPTGEAMHNHFILKSLALTRPGGIVAVLTSRYTMDSEGSRHRQLMADRADLIGAVRLPTGSHQRASGTDVIEDLLIFRVREPGQPRGDESWVHSSKRDIDGFELPVNDYWAQHPDYVLGDMTAEKGRFGTGDLIVKGDKDMTALPATMDKIVAHAQREGLTATPGSHEPLPDLIDLDTSRHEGHIREEDDGTFTQATGGASRPFDVPGAQAPELRDLIGLRDTLGALLTAEAADAEDSPKIQGLRALLNARYDAFVDKYGPVNRFKLGAKGQRIRPRQGNFRSDPMSAVVRALEDYDPVTGTATKADVFTKRAVAPRELRTTADNPQDALTLSMESYGEVNLPAIAKMLGTDEETARKQLGSLVFEQPPLTDAEQEAAEAALTAERLGDIAAADAVDLASVGESVRDAGRLEPATAYLSGNVRRKLAAARAAALHDPRFRANVEALERVIPADLGPEEIDGRIGASWIGPDTIEAFLRDILNERVPAYGRANKKVQVAHSGGSIWTVVAPRNGTLATVEWGTPDRPTPELVQALLEQRSIKVTREVELPDGRTKNVPDLEATLAAQEKAEALQERFAEWLWEDPDRARRLQATYNDKFNALVLRKYEATPDRVFPGMSPDWHPFEHVKAAAERITQEPTVLLAHVVGAGKTSEMAMGTKELRRLGLARKPAIVIPNHMLEQFSREYLQIYPQAKILAAGTEDLKGDKRREFVARAATGDWDAVILTQSAFNAIPMSREQQQAYIDREMAVMRRQLEEAQAADGDQAQKRTVKKMENALLAAEQALKKKLDKQKDVGVTFEQTGIDYLMVDEAHMYSNLRVLSNIQGAGNTGSDRATDLHMKLEYLRANSRSGRVATFASGTPIRNTVTQAYVMQRFLRPDLLEQAGIHTFDQWAGTFGQVVSEMELKPEGTGFRQTERFARFRNVPELLQMFHMFSDVKMAEDLNLPTPNLTGGQMETVVVPASDELRAYVKELGERADDVRAGNVPPEEDNMLKISGDGRKAALSMRLVGQDHQPGKIESAADRIATIHKRNADRTYGDDPRPGALQIVFLDMGTPKMGGGGEAVKDEDAEPAAGSLDDAATVEGWDAYNKLKDELVARGMDADSIRFIHEAKNDAQKAEMFAAARNGRISVIIGSSEKMGVGTNIQRRAVALHHLDAPWRPADVEQRDGRIMRQGNLNPDVEVINYVTEHSFDAYMWQTLERKAKFIHQVMRGKLDVREIEDIGDTAMNYAEVKALTTGNPDLLEKAKADTALVKLQRLERAHARSQVNMRSELKRYEQAIPSWAHDVAAYDAAIDKRVDTHGDKFTMTVGPERYAERTDAAEAVVEEMESLVRQVGYGYDPEPHVIASIGGHDLTAKLGYGNRGGRTMELRFAGVPGDPIMEIPTHDVATLTPGIVSRLERALDGLDAKRERLRTAIESGQDEVARIESRLGKPFPRAAELDALKEKVARLDEKMMESVEPPPSREDEAVPA